MDKKEKKPTVVSLFSGCGGMDLGFINSGFDVIWANDFNQDAVKTYSKNLGDHIVLGDITKVESSQVPDADILIGGFPCQGFSVANTKRSMEDKRNFLYKEMLRIISDKKPKFFVGENVKGLLSIQGGQVIEMIKKDFEDIGYRVDYRVLNAADFGVPQNRQRVIMIGNRLNLENKFPEPTHMEQNSDTFQPTLENFKENLLPSYTTVKETIGHLSDSKISYDPILHNGERLHNQIARTNVHDKFWGRKHNPAQADVCDYLKFWRKKSGWSTKRVDEHFGYRHTAGHWFRKDNNSGSIPKPSDWWELKKILGFDDKFDKSVTELVEKEIKFEQSLRITNWNRPSDTITATGSEIHVNKERRLSVRECAILQTFPNDFIFEGSLCSMYRQIGNAVPVLLSEKIAGIVKRQLEYVRNSSKSLKVIV